jgi:GNAT superfamily N-acetyltransferase
MRIETVTDIEILRPLCQAWIDESEAAAFGMDIDLESGMADLKNWHEVLDAVFLGMWVEEELIGFMALCVTPSALNRGHVFAMERYWFVRPDKRRHGVAFIDEAKKWAKEHGCTHLVMCASRLAGDMYPKLCAFYERMGFEKLETSFGIEV